MNKDQIAPAKDTKAAGQLKRKAESYDISRSDETLTLAKDLANFIKENKLTTVVQGKDFVNVEGWQYAGSRLGIVPIVDHVVSLCTESELKYQATVKLFDLRSQQVVGAGFAVCSNKEQGKKFYQEFAIASMAQTRAIGKAYRNILAWIIRAAGYEPTPAEEMEYGGNQPEPGTGASEVKDAKPAAAAREDEPTQAERVASFIKWAKQQSTDYLSGTLLHSLEQKGEAGPDAWQISIIRDMCGLPEAPAAAQPAAATPDRSAKPEPAPQDSAPRAASGTAGGKSQPTHAANTGRPLLSSWQKQDIQSLLNHRAITGKEKTTALLNINKIDDQTADKNIKALVKLIKEREPETHGLPDVLPGAERQQVALELLQFVARNELQLGEGMAESARYKVQGITVKTAELRRELKELQAWVDQSVAA